MNVIDAKVQSVRAWTGLLAVVIGDVAIATAAIIGIAWTSGSDTARTQLVSILSGAFTAIGTLTTAYLGIKATANTAQASIAQDGAVAARDGADAGQPATDRPMHTPTTLEAP